MTNVGNIWWPLVALWAALAYFVYGDIGGTMAVVIVGVLFGLSMLLALIPFCGVVVQALVMYFLIWPEASAFTEIEATWLTFLMFWTDVALATYVTYKKTLEYLQK